MGSCGSTSNDDEISADYAPAAARRVEVEAVAALLIDESIPINELDVRSMFWPRDDQYLLPTIRAISNYQFKEFAEILLEPKFLSLLTQIDLFRSIAPFRVSADLSPNLPCPNLASSSFSRWTLGHTLQQLYLEDTFESGVGVPAGMMWVYQPRFHCKDIFRPVGSARNGPIDLHRNTPHRIWSKWRETRKPIVVTAIESHLIPDLAGVCEEFLHGDDTAIMADQQLESLVSPLF